MNRQLVYLMLLTGFHSTCYAQNAIDRPPSFFAYCWPDHLSQLPPLNEASCVHLGTSSNVIVMTPVQSETSDTTFESDLEGNCGVWECGEGPPGTMGTCGYSDSSQLCWSVSGNLEIEIKWALLVRLGPKASFGGETSGCNSTTYHAAIAAEIPNCSERTCIIEEVTTVKTISASKFAEVAEFDCTFTNGTIITVGTACGEYQTGTAETTHEVRGRVRFSLPRPIEHCDPCGEEC